MKEMCRILPEGRCLNCGNSQFIVAATHMDLFLTNKHGEVIDSKEVYDHYKGRCCVCGAVYDMVNTYSGFVPMTPLKRLLYDGHTENTKEWYDIENPMEEEHEN